MIEKYPYIFYSVIGPHCGESTEQILQKKQSNIESYGYTVWTAKLHLIDDILKLEKNSKVYVLGLIDDNAEEPAKSSKIAQRICYPEILSGKDISGLEAKFCGNPPSSAYYVKNIEILNSTVGYDFGQYISADNKYFKEYTRNRQNTFFTLCKDENTASFVKPVNVIIELQYPFVVKVE